MNRSSIPAAAVRALTVSEVADALGTSRRLVWSLIAAGRLGALRLGKRTTRIEVAELERFLEGVRTGRDASTATRATRASDRGSA